MQKRLLEELVAAGAVRSLTARGVPGGFVLVVRTEGGERVLAAQRGPSRVFRRLDAVARFLRKLGLYSFAVEVSKWDAAGLL